MKRFYQILLLCLIVPPGAFAQQADTASYTLEQCIKYALENTVDVKNARVDAQISEARVKETVGIGLPQVSGSVSLQHNPKLAFIKSMMLSSPVSLILAVSPIYNQEMWWHSKMYFNYQAAAMQV
jgi:hypothetical protein